MPMLLTLPETLTYDFENIRGIVYIKFGIDIMISEKDTKRVQFYDILVHDLISLESQYNVQNPNWKVIEFIYDINPQTRDSIKISIPREEFLLKFKEYYMKFLKKHTDIIKKYTKKFDPIARKHAKIIESSGKIGKIMKKWIDCKLCYLTNLRVHL